MAAATSRMECCFIKTVEMLIKNAATVDAMRQPRLEKMGAYQKAKNAAIEPMTRADVRVRVEDVEPRDEALRALSRGKTSGRASDRWERGNR